MFDKNRFSYTKDRPEFLRIPACSLAFWQVHPLASGELRFRFRKRASPLV